MPGVWNDWDCPFELILDDERKVVGRIPDLIDVKVKTDEQIPQIINAKTFRFKPNEIVKYRKRTISHNAIDGDRMKTFTYPELDEMNYRELRGACKSMGIQPKNRKKYDLFRLAAHIILDTLRNEDRPVEWLSMLHSSIYGKTMIIGEDSYWARCLREKKATYDDAFHAIMNFVKDKKVAEGIEWLYD